MINELIQSPIEQFEENGISDDSLMVFPQFDSLLFVPSLVHKMNNSLSEQTKGVLQTDGRSDNLRHLLKEQGGVSTKYLSLICNFSAWLWILKYHNIEAYNK